MSACTAPAAARNEKMVFGTRLSCMDSLAARLDHWMAENKRFTETFAFEKNSADGAKPGVLE
ncbi:MAG: hypothetical protein PVS2B2_05630 [Candidatus Acidiferrum sp.]